MDFIMTNNQIREHRYIQQLMDFIDRSPCMYQAIEQATARLAAAGFTALDPAVPWQPEPGQGYYLTPGDSALIAFYPAASPSAPLRLIGTHSDSPALKIKDRPCFKREGTMQINVEPYGGLIMRSWLDRPLGLAGRLVIARNGHPECINIAIEEDLFVIPSLAIHMDRAVNQEGGIAAQNALIPIYDLAGAGSGDGSPAADQLFADLADRLELKVDDIIGHDLFLFPREQACLVGRSQDLLSAPRIDNLAMVDAALTALLNTSLQSSEGKPAAPDCHRVVVVTDCEEIGSSTRTGADSMTVHNILKRICLSLGGSEEAFWQSLARGFLLSCDAAHAVHPAFSDVADPTNRPRLNQGPVIKTAAARSYATDGYSAAVVRLLARTARVPLQTFHNHSDRRGGSTIGPLAERWLTLPGADIGNPLLAMHAVRELAGTKDHLWMIRLLTTFFADSTAL